MTRTFAADPSNGLVALGEVPLEWGVQLAGRLALARRTLREIDGHTSAEILATLALHGGGGRSAAIRPVGGSRDPIGSEAVHDWARAYVRGGGSIDLRHPDRRFWYRSTGPATWTVFEEVGAVDRPSFDARRMPRLPFQRPVSLAPRLGRVAANLARIRPGALVVDPFAGTGALLLEASLLGARVAGVDRDPEMVRGALRNFAHLGRPAEGFTVGDAAAAHAPADGGGWDAVLTDPPYGRSSGSGGESPPALLRRVLPAWTQFLKPGGVVVLVTPGGDEVLEGEWVRTVSVPDRVHRSLTREFRVYERRTDLALSGSGT